MSVSGWWTHSTAQPESGDAAARGVGVGGRPGTWSARAVRQIPAEDMGVLPSVGAAPGRVRAASRWGLSGEGVP